MSFFPRRLSLIAIVVTVLLCHLSTGAVGVSAVSSWLVNGNFETGSVAPWFVRPASATPAVVAASISKFDGKWSMAIAQVYSKSMITALNDLTPVSALQTVQSVPSGTVFTLSYSVAMPISYGLQAFSTVWAYDQQLLQPCQPELIPPATISEYSSFTCTIPAIVNPGTHNLTVGFTGQSAYGYFFLDAITLTS